ncbi:MAG TPA: hypothetical protein VHM20_05905, partial [Gammaproteobacteria bacterium]|nr:hypothetical protein [Gammaproteobacteria bacterium]
HLAIILENSSRPNISNDELLELLRHNPDDRQRIYQRHWLSDIEFFDLQHRALNQQYLPLIDHQLLYSLGLEYLEDPKKQDIKEAERLFKEATAAGNLHASYKLCRAEYFYRLGLKSLNQNDQKKAASQFRQAAAFSSYAAYQRLKRMAEGPFWGLFGGGNPYAQYHLAVLEQSPRLSTIPSHIREECIRDSMDDLRIAGGLGTADSTTYQPMKLLYTTPKAAPLEIKQSDITSAPVTYTTTAPVERTLKEKFLGVFRKKQTPAASIAKLGLHAAKTPDVSLSSPPKPSKNRRVQMTTSSS